jgi:hypothetical protein
MCLMDGLIIQAVLAEFDRAPDPHSVWDKHAERLALGLGAQRHESWADKLAQVAERLLRGFPPGGGPDRSSRR